MLDSLTNVLSKIPALLRVALSALSTVISALEEAVGFLRKGSELLEDLLRKAEEFLLKQGE